MERPRRRRFIFESHATGFSSQINSPRHDQLPVQGAAALPPGGGVSTSRLEDVRFAEIASAEEISVLSEGVIENRPGADGKERRIAFRSSTSSLTNFDLLGTIRAERIVGRIGSAHIEAEDEASQTIFGSGYQRLFIAGREVKIVYNDSLFEIQKFSDFATNQAALDVLRKQYAEDSRYFPEEREAPPKEFGFEYLQSRELVVCSIVAKIEGLPPGVETRGNQVLIPQFGNIFLGEFAIKRNSRRLTMLRFELGCPYDGCGSGGDVCDGGAWYP